MVTKRGQDPDGMGHRWAMALTILQHKQRRQDTLGRRCQGTLATGGIQEKCGPGFLGRSGLGSPNACYCLLKPH